MGLSRAAGQNERPFDLERNLTALSRIQTARIQHDQTIGSSIRDGVISRRSTRPLPNFGCGKPYPPPLLEREEYVVEFDGPDDPLHAQNWLVRCHHSFQLLTSIDLLLGIGLSRRSCR
jgi:MFS transporter, DHA1 family, multidrug resistance protein